MAITFNIRISDHRRIKQIIKKMMNIFADIDRSIAKFQKKTSIACESGCGHCCHSPNVEASALEMFPLADYLIRSQEAGVWYELAEAASFYGRCVFYKPDSLNPSKGRCSIYAFRPAICRLYGFSAVTDKRGGNNLVTCARIKKNHALKVAYVENFAHQGIKIPMMKTYVDRVYQMDPYTGTEGLPINLAFKRAVDKISLSIKYQPRILWFQKIKERR